MNGQTPNERPNLIILGQQKAGTTWLFGQLAEHPQVKGSRPKELFFLDKDLSQLEKRLDEYYAHFPREENKRYYAEASATYFWVRRKNNIFDMASYAPMASFSTPEAAKTYCAEDAKFIVLFRSPVARAISAYYHHFKRDRILPKQSILLKGRQYGILDMGFVKPSLDRWLAQFDRKQFLFLKFEDVRDRPEELLRETYEFLGLKPHAMQGDGGKRNEGFRLKAYDKFIGIDGDATDKSNAKVIKGDFDVKNYPRVYRDEISCMVRWYAPDIKHLENFTGWDLSHWTERDLDRILTL